MGRDNEAVRAANEAVRASVMRTVYFSMLGSLFSGIASLFLACYGGSLDNTHWATVPICLTGVVGVVVSGFVFMFFFLCFWNSLPETNRDLSEDRNLRVDP